MGVWEEKSNISTRVYCIGSELKYIPYWTGMGMIVNGNEVDVYYEAIKLHRNHNVVSLFSNVYEPVGQSILSSARAMNEIFRMYSKFNFNPPLCIVCIKS